MRKWMVGAVLSLVLSGFSSPVTPTPGKPAGSMTWALHATITPTWFDPAETPGIITPFMFLYTLHDALTKFMPGNLMGPSLAESWTVSPDGLVYTAKLRPGLTFHDGDPFTAEDVQFSFERYQDIDELFRQQATELNPQQRQALLHRIQRLVHEKAMFAPIWELALINWKEVMRCGNC